MQEIPLWQINFWDQTLTCCIHCTMSTWVQSEKSIGTSLHGIRNKTIHPPGRPPFIMIYHPPTLEAYTCPTKKSCYSKNYTQFNSLPLYLLQNIGMWHAGLVHWSKKLKPVLVWLTQHNPVLRASTPYKIKYVPFD